MAQASFEPGTSRSRVLRSAHCAILAGGSLRAYSIHPIHLKLGRIILDIGPHNRLCSPIFRFVSRRHLGGVPLEIFKSNHSLQLSDWAETWYDDTRHLSAQSLWAGVFSEGGGRVGISEIFAHVICTFVSPSQKSRSLRSERWSQRPFGAVFSFSCIIIASPGAALIGALNLLSNHHHSFG